MVAKLKYTIINHISISPMDYLLQIDTDFFLAVNSWHSSLLDPIMMVFSHRHTWIPMYLAIAFVLWRFFGWQRALIAILMIGVAAGLSDFVCANCIRPFVERMRPSNPENDISALVHIVNDYRSGKFGFPSCHAANTMALAMASSLILRVRVYTVFIFVWALLQCYSRLYLGVHYPGDLFVGGVVGIFFGSVIYLPVSRYVDFSSRNPRASVAPVLWTALAIMIYVVC